MTIGLFCGNAIVKILSSFSQGAHFILIHTDAHAVCGGAEKNKNPSLDSKAWKYINGGLVQSGRIQIK